MKQKKNRRISPRIFDSRYYVLSQLKKQIILIIKQFIQPLAQQSKPVLVDYGCGDLPYKTYFEPYLGKYLGADLAENQLADVNFLPEGKVELAEGTVDVVLSTQVLEHVENPNFYLAESYRMLKPNGILILTTPNYWMFHPHPTDYWRWTSAGLRKVIEEQGFEIQYFKGVVGRASTGLQLFQDGLIFKFPAFLKPVISMPIQLMMILFDKINSQEVIDKDACNYVVVARKK